MFNINKSNALIITNKILNFKMFIKTHNDKYEYRCKCHLNYSFLYTSKRFIQIKKIWCGSKFGVQGIMPKGVIKLTQMSISLAQVMGNRNKKKVQ